jgi:hypothetical protein
VDGLTGLFLPKSSAGRGRETILSSPELAALSGEIKHAIQNLKDAEGGGNVILVVDQLDLLLAAAGDQIGAVNLGEMLTGLREVCGPLEELATYINADPYSGSAFNNFVSLGRLSPGIAKSDASRKRSGIFGAQRGTRSRFRYESEAFRYRDGKGC